jgi:hypothetical protein
MTHVITPLEKAKKVIKSHFSVLDEKDVQHFPDLTGKIVRMVINYQGKKLVIFLSQTNNDIVVRLFDTSRPEKYYTEKKWVPTNNTRSGRPFVFSCKMLYLEPSKSFWVDMQLPLHQLPDGVESTVFKLYDACKDIKIALLDK